MLGNETRWPTVHGEGQPGVPNRVRQGESAREGGGSGTKTACLFLFLFPITFPSLFFFQQARPDRSLAAAPSRRVQARCRGPAPVRAGATARPGRCRWRSRVAVGASSVQTPMPARWPISPKIGMGYLLPRPEAPYFAATIPRDVASAGHRRPDTLGATRHTAYDVGRLAPKLVSVN